MFRMFSIFVCLGFFCSCSFLSDVLNKPDTTTIFGTYASENGNIYYTLKDDYTWESHNDHGTFIYDDVEETVYFTTKTGEEFNFVSIDFYLLREEIYDEKLGFPITYYYTKK